VFARDDEEPVSAPDTPNDKDMTIRLGTARARRSGEHCPA
jgi:hypothetical protein